MMTNRQYDHLFTELMKPIPGEKVLEKKPGKPHYITARHVMNRLDEVLGPMNWWDTYEPGGQDSILCRLTIRLPDGTQITKCDAGGFAGMANQGDDDKSGYSDSFKRAAVKFGIGRYLYRDGMPDLGSQSTGTHQPESMVEESQGKTGTQVPVSEPTQEATEASQKPPEPEPKGLDGQPFKAEKTFWNDILDEVTRVNNQWLESNPDSEEIVTTQAAMMKLVWLCYEEKVHPINPDPGTGGGVAPDGRPMTPQRWAGVLNKIARKSPEMNEWLSAHLKAFCGEQLSVARKLQKRGTKGASR